MMPGKTADISKAVVIAVIVKCNAENSVDVKTNLTSEN
jgi:hypothetical protein